MKPEDKEFYECLKINKVFGIDLFTLPVEMDLKFVKHIQQITRQNPNLRKKKILFLSHPQFKYHEKNILLYLNRKFKQCDCYHIDHADYSLKLKLDNVRYISKAEIFRSSYDYVIVNKGWSFLSRYISKIRSNTFYVFFLNSDAMALERDPKILQRILKADKKITYFNLFKNTLYNIYRPDPSIKMTAAINWPPSLDVFLKGPGDFLFDFLFMGGGARDYKFLYENQDLFQGKKVIVTHCDAAEHHPDKNNRDFDRNYDHKYLGLLSKIGNFICLNRINENFYCKLLLYSRITMCLFRKIISTDSTCISDAIWYGKPVITTRVEATEHLKDYAFFVENAQDIRLVIEKLEDPKYYRKVTERIQKYAREEYNIFNLLKLIK
ncbi:MAG: hypothetical protein KKH98_00865 [Spirochaetes bacterium]|nr:hypothetical protein [Spirochaetota bacterium]